jgi:hypothetical protein
MKKILILIISSLLIVSCSNNKAPSCNDKEGLKGIHETLEKSYQNKRSREILAEISKFNSDRFPPRCISCRDMTYNPKPTRPAVPEVITEEHKKMMSEEYKKLNPQITGIVIESTDDKTKQSVCTAYVSHTNGFQQRIWYKFARTSDGQIYYELDLRR